jgi:hypothetical protein
MKLTFGFIFNNDHETVREQLTVFKNSLSYKYEYEFIFIFNNSNDTTKKIVTKIMENSSFDILFINSKYDNDLDCVNNIYKHSSGDLILCMYSNVYIKEKNWDDIIVKLYIENDNLACTGLWNGYEVYNKDNHVNIKDVRENFDLLIQEEKKELEEYNKVAKIIKEQFTQEQKEFIELEEVILTEVSVKNVDTVSIPFVIKRELLNVSGLLDDEYNVLNFSDLDLGMRLCNLGYKNLCILSKNVNNSSKKKLILKNDTNEELFLKRYK